MVPAVQAARVHVRARSQLQLQVQARPRGVQVSGVLRDQRGDPIAGAAVALHTVDDEGRGPPRSHLGVTSPDGAFAVLMGGAAEEDPPSEIRVEADFAGDANHGDAHAELTADLGKAPAELVIVLPTSRWTLGRGAWSMVATAQSGGEPLAAVALSLRIDGRQVLELRTDASGKAQASLPLAGIDGLGNHRVAVELAPTERVNGAQAQAMFAIIDAVDVRVQARPGREGETCGADDWCLSGTARRYGSGQAHADAAVTIYADRQIIGTLVSDEQGRFAAVLRSEALEHYAKGSEVEVAAQVAGGRPFVDDGWSDVFKLQLPRGPAWREWLAAAAVAALVLGALLRALWQRRQAKLRSRELEESAAGLRGDAIVYGRQGDQLSTRLAGTVLHGETGRPMPAELWLLRGDVRVDILSDFGSFANDSSPHGAWTLHVRAADHELLTAELQVPHDGRFDGCILQPVSCRAVVRGNLAEAVRKASGRGVDWGRETPRQVEPRWARHLRRGQLEVREAVRVSERALYGERTDAGVVGEVKDALGRVEEAQK